MNKFKQKFNNQKNNKIGIIEFMKKDKQYMLSWSYYSNKMYVEEVKYQNMGFCNNVIPAKKIYKSNIDISAVIKFIQSI